MSNLSSTNEKYEDAKSKYQALASMYTGNSGYQNSLNNAAKGSTAISEGVASQTKAAARNAGLSKSAAAALGQSNVQKAYTDAFTGQQENAYKAGTDAANSAKDVMSNEVTEGNNRYDRAAGNTTAAVQGAGTLASALLSDETMKDKLVNLSNGMKNFGNSSKEKEVEDDGTLKTKLKNASVGISKLKLGRSGTLSDDTMKDLLGKLNGPKSIDDMYADVKNYLYKYNDTAGKEYGEDTEKVYAGPVAQDLTKIPGAVVQDGNGKLEIDTGHLAAENSSAISEILQRLNKLEEKK